MILRINGKEITKDMDVQIENAIYTQYANSMNDTLELSLIDIEGLWTRWINDRIETVEILQDDFNTGILYPHKYTFENNHFKIIARSMPVSRISKRTKEWKQVTFDEIGTEVASGLGLSYTPYGVNGSILYESIWQREQSDLAFFSFVCTMEGCGLLVYDKQLVVYDVKSMEDSPLDTVQISDEGVYRFTINEGSQYGSCTLKWTEKPLFEKDRYFRLVSKDDHFILKTDGPDTEDLPGTPDADNPYDLPSGDPKQWFKGEWFPDEVVYEGTVTQSDNPAILYVDSIRVTSNAQALRWAKGLLRDANKNYLSGWYSKPFHSTHTPGTSIRVSASKSSQIDGTFFIEKIKYDFKNNKTVTYIRGCLPF